MAQSFRSALRARRLFAARFSTSTDPNCVPWDVFGAAPSAAAVNYLNIFGVIQGITSEQIANFNVTGLLGEMGWKTPWAEDGVAINAGVEYRRESLELNPDQSFQTGDLAGQGAPTLPVSGNFRVWEVFGEAQVPIVQNSFIDELTLSAGYRKSWYTTSSDRKYDTDTYKLALEFAPIRDIRFRGSYNRAVRAPNIQELFAPQFVGLDGSDDPCAKVITATDYGCLAQGLVVGQSPTANPAGQYNGLLGGNSNLTPEKGTTMTLGTVLQPSFIPRLALTVDWWDIKLEERDPGSWRRCHPEDLRGQLDGELHLAGLRPGRPRYGRFDLADAGRLRQRSAAEHGEDAQPRYRRECVLLAPAVQLRQDVVELPRNAHAQGAGR